MHDPQTALELPVDLLLAASQRAEQSTRDSIQSALKLVTNHFGLDFGIVSHTNGDSYVVEHLYSAVPAGLEVGATFPLGNTYCAITLEAEDVVSIDACGKSAYATHPCYQQFQLESYIGVPLRVDGMVYGTLNFSSPLARKENWAETDRELVRLIARWVESSIMQQRINDEVATALHALEHANRELALRNEDLDSFTSIASHDLRAPLRRISQLTGILREDAVELDEGTDEYLSQIQRVARRGLELIGDLLVYTRLSRSRPESRAVDLEAVLQGVLEDLAPRIEESGGTIEVLDPLPRVQMDDSQAHQLLQNLLDNALKYHAPDRSPLVTVRATAHEDGREPFVELEITDNGIGFEQDQVEHIFEPFRRLHVSGGYEGTGMGLAICARIARRWGGGLTAEGRPGEGAAFRVQLPLAHARTHAREPATADTSR